MSEELKEVDGEYDRQDQRDRRTVVAENMPGRPQHEVPGVVHTDEPVSTTISGEAISSTIACSVKSWNGTTTPHS